MSTVGTELGCGRVTTAHQGSKGEDTGGETWGALLKIWGETALKRGTGQGQGPEPAYSGCAWGAGRPASWELDRTSRASSCRTSWSG